jgi:hypothetical protein
MGKFRVKNKWMRYEKRNSTTIKDLNFLSVLARTALMA